MLNFRGNPERLATRATGRPHRAACDSHARIIGLLALDRSRESSALSEGDRQALRRLANLAMRLSNRGLIDLVQRRICRDRFSYIAVARKRDRELFHFLDAE